MYAIIQTGGKQYRVSEGDYLRVEKLTAQPGDEIELGDVLLVGGEDGVRVGEAAKVRATVVDQVKGDKVVVFKFKRRKMYRRKRGHRQLYTGLRIDQIDLGDAPETKKAKKAEPPKKASKAAAAAPEKNAAEAKPAEAKPKKKPAPRKTPKAAAKKTAGAKKAEEKKAAPSGDAAGKKSKEAAADVDAKE